MNKGLKIVMLSVLGILAILLFGWITMLLWNWLVPALFNGPYITLWQALGLLLLSKILFGFGRWGKDKGHWKHRYHQKMASMTPEERQRFKARVWEKWCPGDKNTSPPKSDSSNV